MPNPTRDEIKQAAESIIVMHDNHVRWDIKDFYYGERSNAAKVARAYLALREQVDAVMHELEECRSGECYCLERAQAAIKAIEEGQG